MTIAEIIEKRNVLTNEILALVTKFEEETNLDLVNIELIKKNGLFRKITIGLWLRCEL